MRALRLAGLLGVAFLLLGVAEPALATTLVYFHENGSSGRGLYNFDTVTKVSTFRVGMAGSTRFFGWDVQPSDSRVFAVDNDGNNLSTVDIDTGVATLVGNTGIGGVVEIAFNPQTGALYGLSNGGSLYTLNPLTAASTFIGNTGNVVRGMACSPDGTLYGFTDMGKLYRIDPTTGGTTAVGGSGNPVPGYSIMEDATFTQTGELYSLEFSGHIFQTDPVTGNGWTIASAGGSGLLGLFELPAPTLVPEPVTVAGLCLGLAGLRVYVRRRK